VASIDVTDIGGINRFIKGILYWVSIGIGYPSVQSFGQSYIGYQYPSVQSIGQSINPLMICIIYLDVDIDRHVINTVDEIDVID